jgi:NAD-dependent dihydropyrimidine dehydrogenase PreA subunit
MKSIYITGCYKWAKNTRAIEHVENRRTSAYTDFKFWNVKLNEAMLQNDRDTAHEAHICVIICKNRALKQEQQHI